MFSRAYNLPVLIAALGFSACGDDQSGGTPDSPPQEAGSDVVDFLWDEGGESRIEYQEIFRPGGMPPNIQARATAFFWKSKTPKRYEFPLIPGCTTIDFDDRFPMGMGTQREYLDVGTVTYTGGANPLDLKVGNITPPMNLDGLFRPHDGHYRFEALPDKGGMFFDKFDAFYDVKFGGSAQWPPQEFKNAHYMPNAWQLKPPGPGFGPITLVRDTELRVTYEIPNHANRPPGSALNMVVGIVIPRFGPAVDCIEDQLDGEIVIPADMVNYAIDSNRRQNNLTPDQPVTGIMARAHISHLVRELTDGTTHNRKRIDFISIWCFVVPWSAAAE